MQLGNLADPFAESEHLDGRMDRLKLFASVRLGVVQVPKLKNPKHVQWLAYTSCTL